MRKMLLMLHQPPIIYETLLCSFTRPRCSFMLCYVSLLWEKQQTWLFDLNLSEEDHSNVQCMYVCLSG